MSDCFTEKPDFKPYNAMSVDPTVFNPQIALDPLDGKFDWERIRLSPMLDNQEDIKKAPGERQAYGSRLLVRRFK